MSRRLAASLLCVALAGCFGSETNLDAETETPVEPKDVWGTIHNLLQGIPCDVSTVDDKTSGNLKLLAKAERDDHKGANELDIRGNLLAAAGGGGFGLYNVSDPANPVHLASFTESPGNLDVKFSPDNQTVLVGTGDGIVMADVRDPENVTQVGEWSFPNGGLLLQNAHMLFTARIANQDWVFVAPNDNNGVWILKLEGPPEARKLTYVTRTLPVEGGPLGPHDMYVTYDEDLKKWLLYSSDGYHGWLVFDVSDPSLPLPIGGLVNPETGYTHTIQAAKINGKRIVATIAEIGANYLKVYDATVLQAPVLLGVWAANMPLPVNSQHNFNIVAGKLYMAHYSLGVYVFDLTKVTTPLIGTLDLKPVAHYAGGGSYWDAVLKDGLLYTGDMRGGVHIVGYGCNKPGDATLTSTG